VLETIVRLDTLLFLFFNRTIANPVFDSIFPVITNGYFWIAPAILAALVFIWLQKKKAVIVVCLALLTVGISDPVCNRVIKPAVHRLRPCNPQAHINNARLLLGRKTSDSFPSSHAMNMFAQAMLFSFFYRKRAGWFFLFAAIIGFSRIYAGVHYPFDVLGGAVLGCCVGGMVYGGYRSVCLQIEYRRMGKNTLL
jgi:undecaprenyl-diphosphatase